MTPPCVLGSTVERVLSERVKAGVFWAVNTALCVLTGIFPQSCRSYIVIYALSLSSVFPITHTGGEVGGEYRRVCWELVTPTYQDVR